MASSPPAQYALDSALCTQPAHAHAHAHARTHAQPVFYCGYEAVFKHDPGKYHISVTAYTICQLA